MSRESVDLKIEELSKPEGLPCKIRVPDNTPINAPIITNAEAILLLLSPSERISSLKSRKLSSSSVDTLTTISSSACFFLLREAILEFTSFERTLWRNAASRFSLSSLILAPPVKLSEGVRGFHPSPLLSAKTSHAKLPHTNRIQSISKIPVVVSSQSFDVALTSSSLEQP